MTITKAIRAYFLADPTIVALISNRFYPLKLPQSPVYPTITYQKISEVDTMSHEGYSGLTIKRYQLTLWDTQYERAMQLYALVKARVRFYGKNKATFNGQLSGIRVDNMWLAGGDEEYNPDATEYQQFIDFFIGYSETNP